MICVRVLPNKQDLVERLLILKGITMLGYKCLEMFWFNRKLIASGDYLVNSWLGWYIGCWFTDVLFLYNSYKVYIEKGLLCVLHFILVSVPLHVCYLGEIFRVIKWFLFCWWIIQEYQAKLECQASAEIRCMCRNCMNKALAWLCRLWHWPSIGGCPSQMMNSFMCFLYTCWITQMNMAPSVDRWIRWGQEP